MKIGIGADHGGFALKEDLKKFLAEEGHQVVDFGAYNTEAVDYPDLALLVAQAVANGSVNLGVMVDGAGIGSAMAANKVPGVRAALCYDLYSASNAKEHNNANMLTMGGQTLGPGHARKIVKTFVDVPFAGGRHLRRVEKIMSIEKRYLREGR
ncbi:MAG: ribose 5-phosphate isomerase B [Candidatus Riflebacteria bacterium]|nr:ribose 5-phosphate isomerase B [Candidatus Riflebacteria bacterium]